MKKIVLKILFLLVAFCFKSAMEIVFEIFFILNKLKTLYTFVCV